MKWFSKITFCILLLAGILMTFLPISWFPAFYDVRYSGWSMIGGALIIYFLPRILRVRANEQKATEKKRAIELLQFLVALAISADALGALGLYELYQYGFPYSYILHIVMPFIGVILLSMGINKRFNIPPFRAVLIAFALVLIWGVVWEIFENTSDYFLKTRLTGPDQTDFRNTTALNLIQDTAGALTGLIAILLKNKFHDKKIN